METVAVVAVWLFVVTHVDTLIVIGAFYADPEYTSKEVFIGHYIGFTVGLAGAVGGAILAAELFAEWTFLLGLVPLSIGLWGVATTSEETASSEPALPSAVGRIGVISAAGVGLSGENIAVFIPFFAGQSGTVLAAIVVGYLVGAAGVYLLAAVGAESLTDTGVPEWLDRWLVPVVLIGVGGYVLMSGAVAAGVV